MNGRLRFVLAVCASLLVLRMAAAQDQPADTPPAPPAPAAPPPAPSEPAPPPADSSVPTEPAPEPAPAPSSTGSFPPDTPPPVLAPLPDETAPRAAPRSAPPPRPAERAPVAAPPSDASPPPGNSPKKDEQKPPEESLEISQDGLFGPFRIGVLVGGGLPSLLSFAGEIRLTRYFGAGVRFGLIPDVHFSYYGQASVSYQDYGVYAHLHPFGGGFLLGAEVGYAHADGTYANRYDTSQYAALGAPSSIDLTTKGSVQTLILTPEIGYVFTWRAGFTFGFDAGVQIPVAPSHVSLSDQVVAGGLPQNLVDAYLGPDREKVRQTLAKVGQTVLPAFHLRIGWLL